MAKEKMQRDVIKGILPWDVQVVWSTRKTIGLEIDRNRTITVRAPKQLTRQDVCTYIQNKAGWIEKHVHSLEEKQKQAELWLAETITPEELERLKQQAEAVIPGRVAYFSEKLQIPYREIVIDNQKTKWASCRYDGKLMFGCLLMLVPPEVLDYVIVHELCHRKQMNHSRLFWEELERVMPDYRKYKQWLKDYGWYLMDRGHQN